MKPCSKRFLIINIFEAKESKYLIKVHFTVTVYKYVIPFVVPSFNIFWNKGFQKVHNVFFRVTEFILYFLILYLKTIKKFFLKIKNVYKLHLFWNIKQIKYFFPHMIQSEFSFFVSWLIGIKHIWKTVFSYQTMCYCHQAKFFFSSSFDYSHWDDE